MKSTNIKISGYKTWLVSIACFGLIAFISQSAYAVGGGSLTLGGMASTITQSFTNVTKLITSFSYLGGLAFFIAAILKFKQHKDNPTQIPIGTPIALTFVAAALLFLPTILGIAGATMFGSSGGSTAGPTGTVYTSGG